MISIPSLLLSFSECPEENMRWYECRPCRQVKCNETEWYTCDDYSRMRECPRSDCYCLPGLLWHEEILECVPEKECNKIEIIKFV